MEQDETTQYSHNHSLIRPKSLSKTETCSIPNHAVLVHETPLGETSSPIRPDPFLVLETARNLGSVFTIDQLTDELIADPDSCSLDQWGDIHEQLYRTVLPALEDTGFLYFNQSIGLVVVSDTSR